MSSYSNLRQLRRKLSVNVSDIKYIFAKTEAGFNEEMDKYDKIDDSITIVVFKEYEVFK